jgi:hypothetical protein
MFGISTFVLSNKSRIQAKPKVMKKLSIVMLACFTLTLANAQEATFRSNRIKQFEKSQLFAKSSARLNVQHNFLHEIMSYKEGQEVVVQVSPEILFKGKVGAITHDAPELTTVIMQSSEIPGLVLSVSKIEVKGEGVVYRGIMTSKHHSDMLMMEKNPATGEYVWNKKAVAHMIPD